MTTAAGSGKIAGVTGVILAGGASRRMGGNKALLPYNGGRFIETVHRQLAGLFTEVILVTDTPGLYDFFPCTTVPDQFPGMGALAGIHSGLAASTNQYIFAVACDMPYLNPALIAHLDSLRADADVVVPETEGGIEPLHAFYGKTCLPMMAEALNAGERRIVSFFGQVRVCRVSAEEVACFDPDFLSFSNINTPEDYYRLRGRERDGATVTSAVRLPEALNLGG